MATEEVGIKLSLAGRREAAAGLKEGKDGLTELGDAAETAGDQAQVAEKKFSRTKSVLGFLGRGAVIAGGLLATTAAAAGAIGIKTAASMETAKIGFTTMLGSGRKAKAFLSDLADFAAKTPFEFPDLQTAASRLVSAGVETEKIIPMMSTLGDVTAGMGTGSEGIGRATNALQQMIAAQRISAEDLNQLRDAGIPVYDLLASALGKTKGEIVALKDEGKLGKDALDAMLGALETGKGLERFSGLMAKQSKSLDGTWSTLKDTVNMGLAKAVKPALPLVKDLVNVATDMAEKAMPKLRHGVKGVVGTIRDLMKSWKSGGAKEALAGLQMKGAGDGGTGIAANLGKIGDALADVDWAAVKDGLGQGTADTISVFGVAIGYLADHLPELAKYLPFIVAGFAAWKVAQAAGNVVALAAIPLTVAQIASNFALAGAMRANTAATATATTTQKGLNTAMRMNPLGMVITALALLAGGIYLAYQKSETFRGIVDGLWNNVLKPFGEFLGGQLREGVLKIAAAFVDLGRYGVMAWRFLVTGAIKAFDGILSAAESGLGWVPGLGDKIKGARAAFDEFGDRTIAKLERVEEKLKKTSDNLDALAKPRSTTFTITTIHHDSNTNATSDFLGGPARPGGGAGGSGGGTNLPSNPRVSVPQIPAVPTTPSPRFKPDRMPRMETRLYLDGKEIARNTSRHVSDAVARR